MPSDQDRPVPMVPIGPPPAEEPASTDPAGLFKPPRPAPARRKMAELTVGTVVEGPHMTNQVAGAYPLWRGVKPFRSRVVSISPEGICKAAPIDPIPEPRPRHISEDGTFTLLPRFWSLVSPPEPPKPRELLNLEAQALGFRLIAWAMIRGEADKNPAAYLTKVRQVVRKQTELLGWPVPPNQADATFEIRNPHQPQSRQGPPSQGTESGNVSIPDKMSSSVENGASQAASMPSGDESEHSPVEQPA